MAASDVVGLQLHVRGHDDPAVVLWLTPLSSWVVLGYFSFAVLTFDDSQTGADVVHGGWLIAIVGTESLVLLGAPLAPELGGAERLAFVTVYTLWGVGIAFYGIFVTLFAYRIFFLRVEARDMNPLFWVVMGAAAISANAGSTLLLNPPEPRSCRTGDRSQTARPSSSGPGRRGGSRCSRSSASGATSSGGSRSVTTRCNWSLVFPLGMYSVATYKLALAADYSPIDVLARGMAWVALAAWAVTFLGLFGAILRPGRSTGEWTHLRSLPRPR